METVAIGSAPPEELETCGKAYLYDADGNVVAELEHLC